MKIRLFLANFFQVFPFCLVLVHGVFLRSGNENEYQWAVVFSMGLYSAIQVGGVWLISWIPRMVLSKTSFWNVLRVIGGFLYLVDNSFSIILGAGLIGLSQALFYRFSRQMVSIYWKNNPAESDQVFTLMVLALNLSYLLIPIVGAELIKYVSLSYLMVIAIFLSIIGNLLISKNQIALQFDNQGNDKNNIPLDKSNAVTVQTNPSLWNIFIDIFYLGSFVVPYGIMMSLIPLKTKALGLNVETNGKLFSLNALVVIAVLFLKSFFTKEFLEKIDLTRKLRSMSILAWVLVIFAGFVSLRWLVVSFIFWSMLEAIQLPTLERHIFSKREYSQKWIDRILVVDAIGSFVAPLFASVLISIHGGVL